MEKRPYDPDIDDAPEHEGDASARAMDEAVENAKSAKVRQGWGKDGEPAYQNILNEQATEMLARGGFPLADPSFGPGMAPTPSQPESAWRNKIHEYLDRVLDREVDAVEISGIRISQVTRER